MNNPLVDAVLGRTVRCKDGECPNCDRAGLLIHPLRHDVFCSDDPEALSAIAELPDHLGQGVTDIPLEGSRYSVRLLREGYLYVLVDRPGLRAWQAYYVHHSGHLAAFPPMQPPPRAQGEVSCRRMAESAHAMMVALERPEEITQTWWLFTPDPLSPARLDEYRNHAAAHAAAGRMQTFSPQQWVAGARGLAHTLPADELAVHALEHLAVGRAPALPPAPPAPLSLTAALDLQPWPALRDPLVAPGVLSPLSFEAPRLHKAQQVLAESAGAALVLHDPIGITQSLNAWRNVASQALQPWLMEEDEHGASNEWKYLVAIEFEEVCQSIEHHRIEMAETAVARRHREEAEHALRGFRDPRAQLLLGGEAAAEGIRRAIEDAHVADPHNVLEPRRQRARAHAQASMQRYLALLDGGHEAIIDAFDQRAQAVEPIMAGRVAGHLAWLASPQLQAALHAYDTQDLHRGWAFTLQVALATVGMEASEAGRDLLDAWWHDDGMGERSLAWRAYALNNDRLLDLSRAALAETATAPAQGAWHKVAIDATSAGRDLIAGFALADVALLEAERAGRVPWFQTQRLGLLMSWYAQAGRSAFGMGAGDAATRWLAGRLTRMLQYQIGDLGTRLRFEELHSAPNALMLARTRGQLNRRIREAVEVEIDARGRGQGYRLRVVAALTVLESSHLMLKAGDVEGTDLQLATELTAASLALVGGSMQLVLVAGEWVNRGYAPSSLTARASSIWTGGMGLAGGFLMGAAGIVWAVHDAMSFREHRLAERYGLASAYAARSIATASAVAMGGTSSFAASAPFLRYIAQRTSVGWLKSACTVGSNLAARLAARQALLLFLRVAAPKLGLAALVLSAAIYLLTPDAFEEWCERSVFRSNRNKKGFRDVGEEIAYLQNAFREVGL